MNRTRTQVLIDEVAMWSALAIYLVIWVAVLSLGFESRLLIPAVGASCLYVGMHVYEMVVRRHCYLCADSTAVPVMIVAAGIGVIVGHFVLEASWGVLLGFCVRGCLALMLAHVVALLYAATVTTIAQWCLGRRIDAEYVKQLEENRLQNRALGFEYF